MTKNYLNRIKHLFIVSILLVAFVLPLPAFASTGSADDSLEEKSGAEYTFDAVTLADDDNISFVLTEYNETDSGASFTAVLENKTESNIMFSLNDVAVNNIMVDPYWAERLSPGDKVTRKITWDTDTLEASGINYIETVEATLWIYDSDDYDADDLFDDTVSWSVTRDTSEPATTIPAGDILTEETMADGDIDLKLIDYDNPGLDDIIALRIENASNEKITLASDAIQINNTESDQNVYTNLDAGKIEYAIIDLSEAEKFNRDDTVISMDFTASNYDSWEDLDTKTITATVLPNSGTSTDTDDALSYDEISGKIDGDTYINELFDIKFDLPDNWRFMSDDELLDLQSDAIGVIEDEDYKSVLDEMLSDGTNLIVMCAVTGDESNIVQDNVNVVVQRIEGLGERDVSEQAVVNAIYGGEDIDETPLSTMNIEKGKIGYSTVEIAGSEHPAVIITGSYNNIPFSEQLVYIVIDDYFMQITITCDAENDMADTILAQFSKI